MEMCAPELFVEYKRTGPERMDYQSRLSTALCWAQHGRPVFDVDASTVTAMTLADPPCLPVEEIALPFPAFAIRFTEGAPFTIRSGPVHLVWVNTYAKTGMLEDDIPLKEKATSFLVRLLRGEDTLEDIQRCIDASGLEQNLALTMVGARPDFSEDKEVVSRVAWEGVSTQDILDTLGDKDVGTWTNKERITKGEQHALGAAWRMFVNLMLYISATNPSPRKPRPSGRRAKRKKRTLPTVYSVRAPVRLPAHMHEAARAYVHKYARPGQWEKSAAHVVRGHWRNQACGPQRGEHRRIFIAPHWRNRDSDRAVEGLYRVKSDKSETVPL
jgi:hypothetical protein